MKSINKLLCSTAALLACAAAHAADYPNRPIKLVVNSSPGALMDVTARLVTQQMSEKLGQPIVVENRAGADGLIGIRYVKGQPADGYTILVSANTVAQLPAFKKDPGYTLKDFTPIGMIIRTAYLMVGPPSQPAKTVAEFVKEAKASPGKLSVASAGVGTSTHMAAALFMQQAGIQLLHVPYKGNAAALPDVMGGRVNILFDGGNTSGPAVKDGQLRAFGVTSPKRMAAFPDVPTLAEQGLPNYDFYAYHTLLAPAGTPPAVIARLSEALQEAVRTPAVQERLRLDGSEAWGLTPAQTGEFLGEDYLRTVKVVRDLGLPRD